MIFFRVAKLIKSFKTFPARRAAIYSQKLSTSVPMHSRTTVCINILGRAKGPTPRTDHYRRKSSPMYRQIPANLSSLYEREKRDLLPRVRIKRNATTMILHARVQSRHGGRIDTEDITSPARMQEFFIRICQGCSREQRARLG